MRARYLTSLWIASFIVSIPCIILAQSDDDLSNPLLNTARQLNCTPTADSATEILKSLQGNVHPELGLPNESASGNQAFSLHSGTMDVLLKALTDITERFPVTHMDVENTILQWTYCDLLEDDLFFDLFQDSESTTRAIVEYDSPLKWSGFRSLGFLNDKSDRFKFSAYDYGNVPHVFYEKRYHELFRMQCLPHPDEGRLYIDKNTYFPQRIKIPGDRITKQYPYVVNISCAAQEEIPQPDEDNWYVLETLAIDKLAAEKLAAEKLAAEKLATEMLAAEKLAAEKLAAEMLAAEKLAAEKLAAEKLAAEKSAAEKLAAEKLAAEKLVASNIPAEHKTDHALPVENTATAESIPPLGYGKGNSQLSNLEKSVTSNSTTLDDNSNLVLELNPDGIPPISISALKSAAPPKKKFEFRKITPINSLSQATQPNIGKPVQSAPQNTNNTINIPETSGGGIGSSIVIEPEQPDSSTASKKKRTKIGVSGFFNISNKSFNHDGFSLGGGVSYKPIKKSYWFMRSSFKLKDADDPLTYSWGIGYDDWHKKTWSVQLNHWGPLKPGDGFDEKNAIGSISYKFGSSFLSKHKLGSFVSFSQKLSGDPTLTWGLSWSPRPKWFIRSSFSKKLTGGDITWAYGFGYANYSPFSWSLEYNNWGLNEALDTNFKDNGIVTLTYRWSF